MIRIAGHETLVNATSEKNKKMVSLEHKALAEQTGLLHAQNRKVLNVPALRNPMREITLQIYDMVTLNL